MHLNDRNFCEDEQNFDYIVAYHEDPNPNLKRDPLEMAKQLHNYVQKCIYDSMYDFHKEVHPLDNGAKAFAEFVIDTYDLSEGE